MTSAEARQVASDNKFPPRVALAAIMTGCAAGGGCAGVD